MIAKKLIAIALLVASANFASAGNCRKCAYSEPIPGESMSPSAIATYTAAFALETVYGYAPCTKPDEDLEVSCASGTVCMSQKMITKISGTGVDMEVVLATQDCFVSLVDMTDDGDSGSLNTNATTSEPAELDPAMAGYMTAFENCGEAEECQCKVYADMICTMAESAIDDSESSGSGSEPALAFSMKCEAYCCAGGSCGGSIDSWAIVVKWIKAAFEAQYSIAPRAKRSPTDYMATLNTDRIATDMDAQMDGTPGYMGCAVADIYEDPTDSTTLVIDYLFYFAPEAAIDQTALMADVEAAADLVAAANNLQVGDITVEDIADPTAPSFGGKRVGLSLATATFAAVFFALLA